MELTEQETKHYKEAFTKKTKAGGDAKLFTPEAVELFREAGFAKSNFPEETVINWVVSADETREGGDEDFEINLPEFLRAIRKLTMKERTKITIFKTMRDGPVLGHLTEALLRGTIGKSGTVSTEDLRGFVKPDGKKFEESTLKKMTEATEPVPLDTILKILNA